MDKTNEYSQIFIETSGLNIDKKYEKCLFKKSEENFNDCIFIGCSFIRHSGRFDKCKFVDCEIWVNDSVFIDCEFTKTDTKDLNPISRDETYNVYDTGIVIYPDGDKWVVASFGDNAIIYTTDDDGKRKSVVYGSEGGITRSAPVSKEDIEYLFQ